MARLGWAGLIGAIALAALPSALSAAPAPPAGGTISIAPKTADGDYDAALSSFVEATTEALGEQGFTILDADHAAYSADLILSRADVGTGTAKVPRDRASGEPGGAFGSVGVGVRIPLPTGKSNIVPLQRTRLELRIRKRGTPDIVWNGAAVTVRAAGTPKGADARVAADLSNALLRSYPLQPPTDIGVP
ncbi:hypothetical protein ACSBM8_09480 [Sphingomonas sp. ASY06-1R]|uniref:hypothetical protein n=1 Tax=Sphingomonas sp. ASY06-1R TaxID=3445771 RepID=UPI003FA1B138